jgi:hypothetical protein
MTEAVRMSKKWRGLLIAIAVGFGIGILIMAVAIYFGYSYAYAPVSIQANMGIVCAICMAAATVFWLLVSRLKRK